MSFRTFVRAAAFFFATVSTVSATDGAAVFKSQCAKCHGDTGKADTPISKAMKAPALAGDANLAKMSSDEIAALIKGNAKHPVTIKSLSPDDTNAVAAIVKQLAGGK